MIKNLTSFAEPHHEATEISRQLVAKIKQEISTQGPLSFARFMELALYTPGLGYYTAGLMKLGRDGDFITAPEFSALYARSIARQCQQILSSISGDILEFGAGSGRMAAEILLELEQLDSLPRHYYIVEVSADLKERQQQLIAATIPHLKDRVIWLDSLHNLRFQGIILANEVIDAFPVHKFKKEQKLLSEIYVDWEDERFVFKHGVVSKPLQTYLDNLNLDLTEDYEGECNLFISPWIKSLSDILEKGVILIVDYGFPRHEFYHPDRCHGTLMCHYHHQAHTNPLTLIGLQDMTAHVDFTAVAEAALASSLSVAGFTNQANFLISCGMIDLLQQIPHQEYNKLANEVKILTSANEMGELFKVMALTKEMDIELLGFKQRDLRERL